MLHVVLIFELLHGVLIHQKKVRFEVENALPTSQSHSHLFYALEGAETRVSVEMSDYGSASSLPSTQSSMAGPMEGGTLGLMEDMNSVLVTCPSTIDLDAVVQDTVIADITPTPPNFTITVLPTGPDVLQEAQKESVCRICKKVYQSGRGLALHISSAHSKGANEDKSENVAVRKGVT